MEKETFSKIYTKWCELKKMGTVQSPFAEFLEQQKNKEEYQSKSKVLFSSSFKRENYE